MTYNWTNIRYRRTRNTLQIVWSQKYDKRASRRWGDIPVYVYIYIYICIEAVLSAKAGAKKVHAVEAAPATTNNVFSNNTTKHSNNSNKHNNNSTSNNTNNSNNNNNNHINNNNGNNDNNSNAPCLRRTAFSTESLRRSFGRGQMGLALMVPANFSFFWAGTFWVITPFNLIVYSQKCQGVFFSLICQNHNFCSGSSSVDPICPQPSLGQPLAKFLLSRDGSSRE